MEDKKSFVLYADLIHTVEKLDDTSAGELFKHVLRYVNDKDPVTDNLLIEVCFEPIKQQLKRDLDRWQTKRSNRAEAGRKGGLAKRSNAKKSKANVAVNDNVNVNANVNVTVRNKYFNDPELNEAFLEFMKHRKQIKSKMTDLAITKMVNRLEKEDKQNAILMLEQSIENGWKGVFDIKDKKKPTPIDQAMYNLKNNVNEQLNDINF